MNALINVVFPVFGIILTGYLAGRFGVLGPDGALPPIVAALIYVVLFLTSIIAVLEAARTSDLSPLRMAPQLAGTLLRNPVVISPLLGVLYSMTALPLPKALSNYLDLMAAAVGPGALFAVGLSLVGRKLTRNAGEVIWLSALKTAVNPILTF